MYTDNDFRLYHHGVKGQKWGHKNGPPYPINNAKNRAIRNVRKAAKTKSKVDEIIRTLSSDELNKLGMEDGEEYLSLQQGEYVIKRVIKEVGDVPVSFFDVLDDGDSINLAFATRSGSDYRGKGYGSKAATQAMNWLDKHPEIRNGRDVVWGVREDNVASIATAKKLGFELDESSRENGWVNYVKRQKDSPSL